MKKRLENQCVAFLVCDGFEESELTKPLNALLKAGASVHIVSPNPDTVKSWVHDRWSKEYPVDVNLHDIDPDEYDALVLPGGVMNPDKLRVNKDAIAFVKHFFVKKKLIAAVCHGPWTLIETGKIRGRRLTSYHSIKTDLKNAGARWVDKEVIADGLLITSRSPKDLPAFSKKIIEALSKHAK